jgi:hypothetical protein
MASTSYGMAECLSILKVASADFTDFQPTLLLAMPHRVIIDRLLYQQTVS